MGTHGTRPAGQDPSEGQQPGPPLAQHLHRLPAEGPYATCLGRDV